MPSTAMTGEEDIMEVNTATLRAYLEALDEDALWETLCNNTPGNIDCSIMSEAEMIDYGVANWCGKEPME